MGYYNSKVANATKLNPAVLAAVTTDWITELQEELKQAGRQVDRLERKLLIRSKKLGEARSLESAMVRVADLMDEVQSRADIAECAAHFAGEVGRQAVIDSCEAMHEDPGWWLRTKTGGFVK